jgi:BRO1-like domain
MSFLTLLPFRVPVPPLSSSSSSQGESADLASLRRCGVDSDRLVELRDRCRSLLWKVVERERPDAEATAAATAAAAAAAGSPDEDNVGDSAVLACLQEYQSALQDCIERRVPSNHLAFGWRWSAASTTTAARRNGTAAAAATTTTTTTTTRDDSTGSETFVWGRGLEWERRNVVVNVLVLQARQASTILGALAAASPSAAAAAADASGGSNKRPNVSLLQRGIVALQNAATLAHHLADDHGDSDDDDNEQGEAGGNSTSSRSDSSPVDLSVPYLGWLEQYLLGEAQRHVVAMFEALKRQPALLAKMSAACTPLYREAVHRARRFDANSTNAMWPDQDVCVDVARAWGMYFDSAGEYHQAIAHCEKKEWEAAATRLVAALRYNTLCVDFCDSRRSFRPRSGTRPTRS